MKLAVKQAHGSFQRIHHWPANKKFGGIAIEFLAQKIHENKRLVSNPLPQRKSGIRCKIISGLLVRKWSWLIPKHLRC